MTTMAELDRRTCQHDEDINEIYKELGVHGKLLKDHGRQLRVHGKLLKDHGRQLKDHGNQLRDHGRQLEHHGHQLSWLTMAMVDLMTYVGVDPPPLPMGPDDEPEEERDEEE